MKLRLLDRGEEEEWNRFVDARPLGLLGHRAEWRDVLQESLGHVPRYLVAEEAGVFQGVLPLVRVAGLFGGRALVSLPWLDAAGPLADDEQTRDALLRRAVEIGREERCSYVEIRAFNEYPEPRPVRASKITLILRLDDPAEMWKAFDAKVRNQVRKAERSGLEGETTGEEGIGAFYGVFSRNMRDIGVPVWGEGFFRSILRRFGERARIVLVRLEGRPVGGAVLLRHGETAAVPSASSLRSHFPLCPNHMLYWTALRAAHALGARRFDFGRSTRGSGTHRFKAQWGAEERPCFWHYALLRVRDVPERSTASPRLRWAVEAWKRLPLPIANRIGPALVRRIP
ncbi:MAG: FemAB family XrtA/PEP-CTERM system-associated protein [Candidatus Eisenbacteria bacterium]